MCFCSSLTEDKARIAFIDLKAGLPILRVAWKALAEIIASASRTKVNFMDGDVLVVGRGIEEKALFFLFFSRLNLGMSNLPRLPSRRVVMQ